MDRVVLVTCESCGAFWNQNTQFVISMEDDTLTMICPNCGRVTIFDLESDTEVEVQPA